MWWVRSALDVGSCRGWLARKVGLECPELRYATTVDGLSIACQRFVSSLGCRQLPCLDRAADDSSHRLATSMIEWVSGGSMLPPPSGIGVRGGRWCHGPASALEFRDNIIVVSADRRFSFSTSP